MKDDTDDRSHEDFLEAGLSDYENTYCDWDADLLIDHIVILSDYKGKITDLISRMKIEIIKAATQT